MHERNEMTALIGWQETLVKVSINARHRLFTVEYNVSSLHLMR